MTESLKKNLDKKFRKSNKTTKIRLTNTISYGIENLRHEDNAEEMDDLVKKNVQSKIPGMRHPGNFRYYEKIKIYE